MSSSAIRLAIMIIALSTPFSVAAQTVDPDDIEAIERAVEAANEDTAAFAASVAARAESYAEEVEALRDDVLSRLDAYAPTETGGLDDILALTPQLQAARDGERPSAGVMIFASFSMDETALRRLILDAHKAKTPVVLRGFIGGSLGETARRIHALLEDGQAGGAANEALGGVLIDPRAYRVLNITEAPSFVSIAGPLPDCDGLDCSAPAPVHDRIGGNMTLRAALTALSSEGDAAPLQASAALARLEARP